MRLHNRQVKSSFWNDPELMRWPMAKRMLYQGLCFIVDDSGCGEDDAWAVKVLLFPSPMDSEITIEIIATWMDDLAEANKIIRYEANGKKCFFLKNFHKHQRLDNPSAPEVPLPPWVKWEPYKSNPRSGKYSVLDYKQDVEFLRCSYDVLTDSLQNPSNLNLNLNLNNNKNICLPDGGGDCEESETETSSDDGDAQPDLGKAENEDDTSENPPKKDSYTADFNRFWAAYPKKTEKRKAFRVWKTRARGHPVEELIRAAENYARYCTRSGIDQRFMKYPATFLGPDKHFLEFINWQPGEAGHSRASPGKKPHKVKGNLAELYEI